MRTLSALLILATTSFLGCGDDEGSGGSSSTGGSGTGGSGADGGAGATGTGGSGAMATGGNGGAGGSGGTPFVDPLAGIDPVTEISTGHTFTEGTVWMPAQSLLYFSDIPNNEIWTVDESDVVTLWTGSSNGTNGNGLDVDGSMLSCEQSQNRLVRHTDPGNPSAIEVIASQYNGTDLNRPNDVIVHDNGQIYFTDPDYGGPYPLGFQGVYRVDVDAGNDVILIDDTMDKPNGIALSPDQTTLYVTDAAMAELWSFDLNADGSVVDGSKVKLADTNGSADGFAVDDQGYLYLTTTAGIDVHAPDGSLFGNIPVPTQPANCTFGGADRRTLYITARENVYRVTLNVPGLP